MSTNGHVVTLKAAQNTDSNRGEDWRKRKSEKLRLDGNIAWRKIKGKEFFWWDTELPGLA